MVIVSQVTGAVCESEIQGADAVVGGDILVPVANPGNVQNLITLAAALARSSPEANARIVALHVRQTQGAVWRALGRADPGSGKARAMQRAVAKANSLGIAVQPVACTAKSVTAGILAFTDSQPDLRLILLGWGGPTAIRWLHRGMDQKVARSATTNVAVLYDHELNSVQRILVPVSDGTHARLGLRLARDLVADGTGTKMTALRVLPPGANDYQTEREEGNVRHLIGNELGNAAQHVRIRVVRAQSVVAGVLNAAGEGYDLIIIGASERGFLRNRFLGSIPEQVAERSPCSVLMVRRKER